MTTEETQHSIKTTTETRTLKCNLSEEELREAADTLARKLDELESLEEAKKKLVADFKAQVEAVEAEARLQKNLVRDKYRYAQIQCKLILNYTQKSAAVVRIDTGEVVQERDMRPDELQMDMGFDGDENETPVDEGEEATEDGNED